MNELGILRSELMTGESIATYENEHRISQAIRGCRTKVPLYVYYSLFNSVGSAYS